VPTTRARRQPEQVRITGSEGEVIIYPPDSDDTPRYVAFKVNEFEKCGDATLIK